jgi:hypothetical protein
MFKLPCFSLTFTLSFRKLLLTVTALLLISGTASAQNGNKGTGKAGKDYVSAGVVLNEFRSVLLALDVNPSYDEDGDYQGTNVQNEFPLTAQTYGYQLAYGSYIDDYFKAEFRLGGNLRDDTLKEAYDINLSYWFSGYLGFQHPITDYMSGYFMYGVSFFEADTTRRQVEINVTTTNDFGQQRTDRLLVEPSPEFMEDGLFDKHFSPSWTLGLEFDIFDDFFLVFEYGRLLKDSGTNIKVRQAGTHIRYEF